MTAKTAEKSVVIHHTGDIYGPMDTVAGRLNPGQSLSVPESVANTLCSAYKHIKRAEDVFGAGAVGGALTPGEKAKAESALAAAKADADKARADHGDALKALEAEKVAHAAEIAEAKKAIDELVGLKDAALEDARGEKEARAAAEKALEDAKAAAAPAADVAALQGVIRDFLGAKDKKELDALKAKHKDAVPAGE